MGDNQSMSYSAPTPPPAGEPPHREVPPEAPVTPAYGSPVYAVGQAPPRYPPTAQYPVVGAPPPYAPPPARRRRGGLLAGVAAAVVISVLLCIGGVVVALALSRGGRPEGTTPAAAPTAREAQPPEASPTPNQTPVTADHVIVYEVTGDGPANISYVQNAKGGTKQLGSADLPWRLELNMGEGGFLATVLAIRIAAAKGTLHCRLLVDGVEVSKRQSQGRVAAVTCADLVLG
jgi:hypothetical protein